MPTHSSAGISKTSIYVAAGRAVGAREPDSSARNPDYLAEKFLGDPSQLTVDHPAVRALSLSMQDVEVVSNVRMMMIRTRFIDEALARAADGATQVVVLGGPPANLTYVPIDFQHENLEDVLTRHGYDPAQRSFFILDGVTMYVPEDAVRATLRFLASHPPGSGIVFDFVYRGCPGLRRGDGANGAARAGCGAVGASGPGASRPADVA